MNPLEQAFIRGVEKRASWFGKAKEAPAPEVPAIKNLKQHYIDVMCPTPKPEPRTKKEWENWEGDTWPKDSVEITALAPAYEAVSKRFPGKYVDPEDFASEAAVQLGQWAGHWNKAHGYNYWKGESHPKALCEEWCKYRDVGNLSRPQMQQFAKYLADLPPKKMFVLTPSSFPAVKSAATTEKLHPEIAHLIRTQLGIPRPRLDAELDKDYGVDELDDIELRMGLEELGATRRGPAQLIPDSVKFTTVKDIQDYALKHRILKKANVNPLDQAFINGFTKRADVIWPALAGATLAAGVVANQSMGPKNSPIRRAIKSELHDPRLYSNLKHIFSSKKERVKFHKGLSKHKDSKWEAMKAGFLAKKANNPSASPLAGANDMAGEGIATRMAAGDTNHLLKQVKPLAQGIGGMAAAKPIMQGASHLGTNISNAAKTIGHSAPVSSMLTKAQPFASAMGSMASSPIAKGISGASRLFGKAVPGLAIGQEAASVTMQGGMGKAVNNMTQKLNTQSPMQRAWTAYGAPGTTIAATGKGLLGAGKAIYGAMQGGPKVNMRPVSSSLSGLKLPNKPVL